MSREAHARIYNNRCVFAIVEIAAVAANTRREDQDTGSANVKP